MKPKNTNLHSSAVCTVFVAHARFEPCCAGLGFIVKNKVLLQISFLLPCLLMRMLSFSSLTWVKTKVVRFPALGVKSFHSLISQIKTSYRYTVSSFCCQLGRERVELILYPLDIKPYAFLYLWLISPHWAPGRRGGGRVVMCGRP